MSEGEGVAWTRVRPVAPARLGVDRSLATHAPVLALTLLRSTPAGDEVLVGVRTKHNSTHAEVMSVPTQRVSRRVAGMWTPHLTTGVLSGRDIRRLPEVAEDVRLAVEALMARKLGKADALERHEVEFGVEAMLAVQGESLIGSFEGRDVVERLTMFNVQVRWQAGHHLDERRTASYDPLLWISEGKFGEMVRTRDVGVLDAGLDAIDVCVRGLCVESAVRSLELDGR